MAEFFEDVESVVARYLSPLGFTCRATERSEAFGNAWVILEGGNLRLRLVRDRGQIFLDLGSMHDPDENLFDSAIVVEHLNPGSRPEASNWSGEHSLKQIAQFVSILSSELQSAFSLQRYAGTTAALRAIQARLASRFG